MDAQNSRVRSHPPRPSPSPPQYEEDFDSPDEYPSEDEALSDHDLHVLHTDYALQKDLTFCPAPPRYNHYNPSIPPSLKPMRNPADDVYDFPQKYQADIHKWDREGRLPLRTTSLGKDDIYNGGLDYRSAGHNARAYQFNHKRRPLIDLIRNEWQQSIHTPSSSPTSSRYSTPNWIQVVSAPRFRRYVLLIFMFFSFTVGNWKYWAGPKWTEHKVLTASLKERIKTGEGWFSENMRPEFLDMIQVRTLNRDLVPKQGDRKRLIVVGDVHGCNEELISLLAEFQYEARTDHLIFAGDFISKGPNSPAVVDLAMSAHASCVRGNHEDRVILAYRDMYAHRLIQEQAGKPLAPAPGMPEDMQQNEPEDDEIEQERFSRGDAVDRQLAGSFTKAQIDYIASCSVILDIGRIKGLGDLHVVHAGLIPGVRLERQDPMGVMHMRTIDLDTHVPSSSGKGMPWFKLWNKYQSLIPAHQRSIVIYGHDSRRGLQLEKYSKGIDTGCVKGGRLSALVIENDIEDAEPKLVSVRCTDYREPEKQTVQEEGEKAER